MKQSRNTKPRMAVTLALAALVAASVGIVAVTLLDVQQTKLT